MISDIFNKPYKIEVEGETYTLDYDNKSYAKLEQLTGKGLFKLYDEFVVKNNLSYSDCVDIACCAMLKNHTEGEAAKVRIALNEKRFLFMQNIVPITMAFIEPLTPPDVMKKNEKQSTPASKKKRAVKK